MKPIIAALLLLLTPMAALSQHQQHSKAKKLEWIGIGAIAGGIAGTVIGIATGREAQQGFHVNSSGNCTTIQSPSTTVTSCVTVTTTGTINIGTITNTVSSTPLRRATNWKIAGPAIGAAGAGALMLELAHLQVKRAEFSIRPDGGVKVAFKW